jgi:hypothetical protein
MTNNSNDPVDQNSRSWRSVFSPVSLTLQGMTIEPGDPVLVTEGGKSFIREYAGINKDGEVYMELTRPRTSAREGRPGPFNKAQLSHPCLLSALVKEIFPDE